MTRYVFGTASGSTYEVEAYPAGGPAWGRARCPEAGTLLPGRTTTRATAEWRDLAVDPTPKVGQRCLLVWTDDTPLLPETLERIKLGELPADAGWPMTWTSPVQWLNTGDPV